MRALLLAASLATFFVAADVNIAEAQPKFTTRKDPQNRKGISPYMEAVVRGQAAFIGRDLAGSKAAFQEAIKLDPEQSLAMYRLAEVLMEEGKLDDAEGPLMSAKTKKGSQEDGGKVLFLLSVLRERQQKWDAAKEQWAEYNQYLTSNPKAKGHPAVATEHIKLCERRLKDLVDYGAVKDRIEKRRQDLEKEAQENAKKDKLNR